jgi:hypothetical protein
MSQRSAAFEARATLKRAARVGKLLKKRNGSKWLEFDVAAIPNPNSPHYVVTVVDRCRGSCGPAQRIVFCAALLPALIAKLEQLNAIIHGRDEGRSGIHHDDTAAW